MSTYQVVYNKTTKTARIQADGAAVPGGSVDVGSFTHPDPIAPGSTVAFHKVRDLLYKKKASDPSQVAMFPENITDMENISIIMASVTGVSLAPATASIAVAATQQLTPTVSPADAMVPGVTYESSDPSIATVSSTGLVTGVAEGEATITVKTNDGLFTDTTEITVTE